MVSNEKLKPKHTYVLNDGHDGWETSTGKTRFHSGCQNHFKLTVPTTNLRIVGHRVAFRTGGPNGNGTFFARSQTGFGVGDRWPWGCESVPATTNGAMWPGRGHLGRGRGTVGHKGADLGLGTQSVGIANEMLLDEFKNVSLHPNCQATSEKI